MNSVLQSRNARNKKLTTDVITTGAVKGYPQLSLVRVKELCELLSYWNGASFICRSQIERFIKLGIPPSLRGRVWKCLLAIDSLKEKSDFNYQKCLSEVRGPLVDLGISEYGILSAIATLSETQNDPGWNHQQSSSCHETSYSVDDITVFRQIALDLQRSFPTHRSLMGESPEAIEGQAKLFRILIAYSKYNPHVGYSQGMSYLAAVLLMQLEEEEAFWALTALLEKPKYLGELFDFNQTRVQHQVKMFDQFLKHRKPKFSQHMESVGVLSVHFLMPWFLTLFTSLPCWDSVLAVWDLIILDGLSAVFRTALTIIELLEPKLMDLNDEGVLLPLLLRVPVDVAQYTNLVPSLWNTEVHDWELKCMSSLVMDNSHHGLEEENCRNQNIDDPTQAGGGEKENVSTPHREESTTEKDTGTGVQRVLCHVMRLAQQYLLDPIGRQGLVGKSSKTQAKPRQCSSAPGRVFRARGSASLTHAQITSRRRSQQRGRVQQPPVQNNGGDLIRTSVTVSDTAGNGKADRTLKRTGTGPIGKVAHFHGKRGPFQPARVKAQHVLRNDKNLPNQLPNSSSNLACPSTTSQSAQILSSSPPSSDTTQSMDQLKQQDTPRTALLK
ncbi:uncharacterized protein si:ch211-266k8.4 [Cheilinus undulatus]|uniref:uncharacterized protein si:ch211-266k8.4 n=1 Tax=Cheilinus undulatus TaxID=241271 RepID=UPI001BD6D5A4|nr:uncharacterized protein si:ch211-266k8.4 [Cheilinus undulatus]